MARATYIYLLKSKDRGILGLFTVKHEAISYKERNPSLCNGAKLYRSRDGQLYEPVEVESG